MQTIFEKGHTRNIPVKLVQNLTSGFREEDFLRILHVHIVQEAPIHQSHVYGWIKISQTVFEKGHPRSIPAELFQNLTSCFGEDFFKEFLHVQIVQEAPIHQSHAYGWIKIS